MVDGGAGWLAGFSASCANAELIGDCGSWVPLGVLVGDCVLTSSEVGTSLALS